MENIYKIYEIEDESPEIRVNEMIKAGWVLLNVLQRNYSEGNHIVYILGITKENYDIYEASNAFNKVDFIKPV